MKTEKAISQLYELGYSAGYTSGYTNLLYELFDYLPLEIAQEKYAEAARMLNESKELRKEIFSDETPTN